MPQGGMGGRTTVCDHSLGMSPAIARARRDGLIYALIASAGDGAALADAVGVDVGAGRHGAVGEHSRSSLEYRAGRDQSVSDRRSQHVVLHFVATL